MKSDLRPWVFGPGIYLLTRPQESGVLTATLSFVSDMSFKNRFSLYAICNTKALQTTTMRADHTASARRKFISEICGTELQIELKFPVFNNFTVPHGAWDKVGARAGHGHDVHVKLHWYTGTKISYER